MSFVRLLSLSALLMLLSCQPGKKAPASDPPNAAAGISSADVEALKISQLCAESAQKFWLNWQQLQRRMGSSVGATDSYTSHYNREQKKCLVDVTGFYAYPDGGSLTSENIFDAVEQAGIASRHTVSGNPRAKDHTDILDADSKPVPNTPENNKWFEDLMKK